MVLKPWTTYWSLEWQTERTSLMRLCYGNYAYLSFHFSWIETLEHYCCATGYLYVEWNRDGIHMNSKTLLLGRATLGFRLTLYFVAGQVVWKCKLRLDCQMRKGGSRSWASIVTRWKRTHFSVLMLTWKNLVDSYVGQSCNFGSVEISVDLFHWLQVVCFI